MSIYNFLPSRARPESQESFVTWREAFTSDQIKEINNFCDNLVKNDGVVGSSNKGEKIPEIRRNKVSWIAYNPETSWIYDRLAFIARSINSDFFRFNLYGFVEDIQFSLYSEDDESHYTWHIDSGKNTECARKLSLVLQLSSPYEYEGGILEIFTGPVPEAVDKEKGLIAAFPSYTLHRVTPVIKGTRKSLVVWVAGPEFV
jgi:PKHD-type hydroxylase